MYVYLNCAPVQSNTPSGLIPLTNLSVISFPTDILSTSLAATVCLRPNDGLVSRHERDDGGGP
jgi:hypothetical protein